MNEEYYTREAPKRSTERATRNQDKEKQPKQKAHSDKLKNETSAADSFRKKLRHGKKDNTITREETKKSVELKRQGRKKSYADEAARVITRNTAVNAVQSECQRDDNTGIDALELGAGLSEASLRKSQNYSRKMHTRNEQLDAIQGKNGARAAGEAGEGSKSMAAKAVKKKQMQKEFAEAAYKKQAKEAANSFGNVTKRFTDKAEDLMGRLAEAVREFLEEHPSILLIAAIVLIVVLVLSGALTSCSAFMGGGGSLTVETSFTSQNEDIVEVEANYVSLETDLQTTIRNIEADHPGYDEYNYSLAEIAHNPFELAALLTVLYEDYTPAQVQGMLQTIFDYQYTLTLTEVVETRTRKELDDELNEVEVEYEYYILNTTLTNNGIIAAVNALNLDEEQLERYQLLLMTLGNKPDVFGDNLYACPNVSPEFEDYAVPGEYLTDLQFGKLLHEAEKYLGYPYVWGGSKPSTSFDCSGFVSYVINHCGNDWNYGRLTANGWKNVTARVSAADVKAGDLVFFQGTYNTSGASHVGIVVDPVNKIMIHCGNPVQYACYDTTYWRAHAYCYGRIQ